MPAKTPFHERAAALCTSYRWKEWAGFLAACSYDPNHEAEYFALRETSGLIDVSPLFKYAIEGPDAGAFLAFVMARDVRRLRASQVAYACLCDERGKMIDDGTVTRLAEQRYRLTSAGPVWRWLEQHARGFTVTITDVSESLCALAVQGPTSLAVLEAAAGPALRDLAYFHLQTATIAGVAVEISRTGYTGDLGYEIWAPASHALALWDALASAGNAHGLAPVGLDALDMTRVEAGFVLQGVDYFSAPHCLLESRKSSPFELGLGWTVHLDRGPFVGRDALRRERQHGSKCALIGLETDGDELEEFHDRHGLPPHLPGRAWREAVPVFQGDVQIGQATSGTWSPILKKSLALATVPTEHARTGTRLQIEQTVDYERGKVGATVVERPFFDPGRKRA